MGLREYVVRRVAQLSVTYWIFLTLLFVLFRVMPGDPVSMYVFSGLSGEARQQRIQELGLNQPLHEQYVGYLQQLLTGNFGTSIHYREPVWDVLAVKFWNTIFLMAAAITLAYLIGILGGSLLGWMRGTKLEKRGVVVTLMARSSAEFWIGILLIMVFVFWLDWFPAAGMLPSGSEVTGVEKYLNWDFLYHLTLPALTGAIFYLGTPTLLMRNTMLDVLDSDFIEIKQAEGLPPHVVLYKHAARNSILPLVTVMAIVTGSAMGGSVVIETVFNWPGMGREMVNAVKTNDYPLAMGAFFIMGSVVMFMNFVADITYVYLDPRVKYE